MLFGRQLQETVRPSDERWCCRRTQYSTYPPGMYFGDFRHSFLLLVFSPLFWRDFVFRVFFPLLHTVRIRREATREERAAVFIRGKKARKARTVVGRGVRTYYHCYYVTPDLGCDDHQDGERK